MDRVANQGVRDMKANVGGFDRALRIAAGIALLMAVVFVEGPMRWWGLVGIVPLLTGTFRFCPAYLPFGLSTCAMEKKGA
jgi:hypothetical protein